MTTSRHRTFLVLTGGAAYAALIVNGLIILNLTDPFNAQRLDPTSWAASEPLDRAPMARDVIRRHLPPGTPEAKIVALIGEPDGLENSQRLTASAPRGAVRTYSYYLGGWPIIAHDSTFLWVHVDAEGRVIKAVIGGA